MRELLGFRPKGTVHLHFYDSARSRLQVGSSSWPYCAFIPKFYQDTEVLRTLKLIEGPDQGFVRVQILFNQLLQT